MADIQLVETSLRDGNQSLWGATGLNTAMMLQIAPAMERVGFKAIDFTTSTHMAVAARFKQEDPWERLRLMAALTPNTPLQFLSTGFRFISWETASPEFMALAYATLVKNGIRRFALADPMNDTEGNLAGARMARQAGADYVVGALVYTLSPIHDDAHYVDRATALAEVSTYFDRLAEAEGLPSGKPQGFDAAYLHHQLPGGMVGTMRRHLSESRLSHMEGAVIEELGRVREELGWPIVMTPFAQMVLTQAVMNVTGKERYAVIPDEVIRYAIGRFGRPNVPIAPEVMDRIDSLSRTRELRVEADMAPVAELRRRLGPGLSDEEFLLRATMPGEQVDAMQASGPPARSYDPGLAPVMDLIRKLAGRQDLARITVDKPGFRLDLRKGPQHTEMAEL